ncbi:acyl-CoA Delta-9 desaturase [Helicoverpa armigera]|uniref:acyl-CoA Delta-9 desaturase n=1 Tax=Helicoverpa armigera TaxID=29058 RepID=UPI0030828435
MTETVHKLESFLSKDNQQQGVILAKNIGTDYSYKHTVVWQNVIGFVILHVLALWGLLILVTGGIGINTFIWTIFVTYLGAEGITTGAHRYFTHRTFKATPLCRAILLTLQTLAGQNCMFIWCRDHRLHHRYSDTDGDPHNSKRGFFFCHMGWLMHKKHPYVIELGRRIDMSDMQSDWMVMFQKKYYYPLYLLLAIFIPMYVPVHFFGEHWWNSLLVCYFLRYVYSLHGTWFVNSIAHLYGTRPYDKNLQPVESWFVSVVTLGEGWHNYHHAFPWDYKAAELSNFINHSATFIEFLDMIGLAYDLKTASPEMVLNRIVRTGDGSHYLLGDEETRKAVTAWGPLHPLNPTYNSTLKPPSAVLKPEGLPLFHEKDVLNLKISRRSASTA